MPRGIYERKTYRVGNVTPVAKDRNIHECKELRAYNDFRGDEFQGCVFIFKDVEAKKWNIKVGLEFLQVNYCPWCGRKVAK